MSLESRLYAALAKRDRLTGEIKRLEAEKKTVTSVKKNIEQLKRDADKKNSADKLGIDWKGQHFEQYLGLLDGPLRYNMKQLYDDVDTVLDTLCDEITKRENEKHNQIILIGWLRSEINSLGNEVEKAFN